MPDLPSLDLTAHLRPGDGVWWGQAGAEPEPLVNTLLDQACAIGPLRAFTGLTWNERFAGELPTSLSMVSCGGLGQLRGLSRRGVLDVVPCHYSALPRLFARRLLPPTSALSRVSPPDADGTVSLGIGVEYVADALPHARTLIAEVNQRMPRTAGAPVLPLSAFSATVETDRPLPAGGKTMTEPALDGVVVLDLGQVYARAYCTPPAALGRHPAAEGLRGMDVTVQAVSGIVSATGFPDGPPVKAGGAVVDFSAGPRPCWANTRRRCCVSGWKCRTRKSAASQPAVSCDRAG